MRRAFIFSMTVLFDLAPVSALVSAPFAHAETLELSAGMRASGMTSSSLDAISESDVFAMPKLGIAKTVAHMGDLKVALQLSWSAALIEGHSFVGDSRLWLHRFGGGLRVQRGIAPLLFGKPLSWFAGANIGTNYGRLQYARADTGNGLQDDAWNAFLSGEVGAQWQIRKSDPHWPFDLSVRSSVGYLAGLSLHFDSARAQQEDRQIPTTPIDLGSINTNAWHWTTSVVAAF